MRRVLITRPRTDAESLADALRERGAAPVIEPLVSIVERKAVDLDWSDVGAVALTSANGARSLAKHIDPHRCSVPILAVGERTAETARSLGFPEVQTARGTVETLAELIVETIDAKSGEVLHAAGAEISGDLSVLLAPHRFRVRREVLYEAVAASTLSPNVTTLLREGEIAAAFFYSARTVNIFVGLAERLELVDPCRGVTAYCLSKSVAEALESMPFRAVRTAVRPSQADVLALFDADTPPVEGD